MSEAKLEKHFLRKCKILGYWCVKLIILNKGGFPDRTVLAPEGTIAFVELKNKKKSAKVRANQIRIARMLMKLGFDYYIISSEEQVANMLKELKDEVNARKLRRRQKDDQSGRGDRIQESD